MWLIKVSQAMHEQPMLYISNQHSSRPSSQHCTPYRISPPMTLWLIKVSLTQNSINSVTDQVRHKTVSNQHSSRPSSQHCTPYRISPPMTLWLIKVIYQVRHKTVSIRSLIKSDTKQYQFGH